jgi:hypothetical protein
MGVKFKELSSYYKLLFMFGDYGYDISAEIGKELDYLTKLYLVKAFMGILVQSAVSPRRCEEDIQNTYHYPKVTS